MEIDPDFNSDPTCEFLFMDTFGFHVYPAEEIVKYIRAEIREGEDVSEVILTTDWGNGNWKITRELIKNQKLVAFIDRIRHPYIHMPRLMSLVKVNLDAEIKKSLQK